MGDPQRPGRQEKALGSFDDARRIAPLGAPGACSEHSRILPQEGLFGRGLWSGSGRRLWRGSGPVCFLRRRTATVTMPVTLERTPSAGGEAGTPPGDRSFRPDVQGLRAIAILLALVYHAGIPPFSGGYVGIEVFFVISGFVITGLLLRERSSTGHTSLRRFYGRRARRIIPMATLVVIVTVIATYHSLGTVVGHETAVDGKWATLF